MLPSSARLALKSSRLVTRPTLVVPLCNGMAQNQPSETDATVMDPSGPRSSGFAFFQYVQLATLRNTL